MRNDFLDYYGEHNISPVRQDISDLEVHYERREKLYKQCGIPIITFRNAEILEVGPGGGYNTLAFFHWNSKHVDLVEANAAGRRDINRLFSSHDIAKDKYDIFPCKIEDYETDKKYDIIIAESFLPYIFNQYEVMDKLKELVTEHGIIVITCAEHAGFFVETVKRLVGKTITVNIPEYDKKVEYLTDFFAPQLAKLRGVSRKAEDWVKDQILNPAIANEMELTMLQAIEYFEEGFDVLGCSPQMFTDYSWYKDIWYDYKQDYKEQFNKKRLSLLLANMPELILPVEQADVVVKCCEKIRMYAAEYETKFDIKMIDYILDEMKSMKDILQQYLAPDFLDVYYEINNILLSIQKREDIDIENYPHFFSAFGRTQQYISFVKK